LSINAATYANPCYESHGIGLEQALAKPTRELFRRTLDDLMEKRGVKNTALAAHVGVSKSVVTHWRNGDTVPEMDKLSLIADFLDVPVAQFLVDLTDPRTLQMCIEITRKLLAETMHEFSALDSDKKKK
jgi:transcriptional regulator with XRE-family HTH domain